ncbi:peptidylprolyl isomerase [bacterium]|nr:peptidylprolyl isomerase [bacterium]
MMDKVQAMPSAAEEKAMEQTKVDSEIAVMKTNKGTITLGFFPDVAPNHVKRFKDLSREGVYDGVHFHRVIPNFMIQGGDPLTKDPKAKRGDHGTGGSKKPDLNAEFNKRSHVRGTLSAARSQSPNSANSQFFICVKETPHLDGKYTVYGQVIDGMDVVDAIVSVKRDNRDNPLEPVVIESVTIKERDK